MDEEIRRSEGRFGIMSEKEKLDTYHALRKEEYEVAHSRFYNYITYGIIVFGILSIIGLVVFLNPELMNLKVIVLFFLTSLGGLSLIAVGYKGILAVNDEYADELEEE